MTKISVKRQLTDEERKDLKEYSDIVAHLLFHRGITQSDQARIFFDPDYESGIHDPFLFDGMEKAILHVLESIKNKKKICIYSDWSTLESSVEYDEKVRTRPNG